MEAENMRDKAPAVPHFSALGVLRLTLSIFWKNPLLYLVLALIAHVPGISMVQFTATEIGKRMDSLASSAFLAVFMGPVAYSVYKGLDGKRAGIGEALRRGLSHYRALITLSILSSILIFCMVGIAKSVGKAGGLIALVGMIYCSAVFAVITPACVVERLGTKQSFLRSAMLTRGHRWGVFCLFFLGMLGSAIVSVALYWIFPSPFPIPTPYRGIGFKIATQILNIITTALFEVGYSVLYYQLRSLKESIAADELARVFE